MAVPKIYANNFVAIKHMLSCYRALADGRAGIRHLELMLKDTTYIYSEWKIVWIGTCATLRTSIDLFKIDSRSCLSNEVKAELKSEWDRIKDDAKSHPIYWEFLKRERDSIIHEYAWTAYKAWLEPDGTVQSPPTILGRLLVESEAKPVLLMSHGRYAGQNSLSLLIEAADWAEERIFSAIRRAGFDPDEKRGLYDFRKMPDADVAPIGLLATYTMRND